MRRRHGADALLVCVLLVLAGCVGGPATPTAPASGTTDAGTGGGEAATPTDLPPSATPKSGALTAEVLRVVDGDTMEVRLANGSRETVRLLGVDTPEVHAENTADEFEGVPETTAGRDCLRGWGENASAYAKQRLAGETVRLSFDANEPRRGYYGRLLVYLHVGGDSFNYGLLTRGLARVYDSEFQYGERYRTAESAAMDAGTGLWACRAPGATDGASGDGADGTAGTGTAVADGGTALRVVEVHADAEGPDGENLNDEYVVLRNAGGDALDLSGWTVSDTAGHRYTFPDGTSINAGASLTLHTGSGEDGDGDYYRGAGSPVWNNGGDTVTVRAANGSVVVEREYGG